MFNLFKKKDEEISVIDKVIIDETAKFRAMLAQWEKDKETVFVCWFDETLQKAAAYFSANCQEAITLLNYREATSRQTIANTVIFGEHYPLRSKEQDVYQKLDLKKVQVFSSLNEPLFRRFGSDKIIALMRQMGLKDDEVIEHKMVSKAIRNAQEKIQQKVMIDQAADSQQDWLERNLTG